MKKKNTDIDFEYHLTLEDRLEYLKESLNLHSNQFEINRQLIPSENLKTCIQNLKSQIELKNDFAQRIRDVQENNNKIEKYDLSKYSEYIGNNLNALSKFFFYIILEKFDLCEHSLIFDLEKLQSESDTSKLEHDHEIISTKLLDKTNSIADFCKKYYFVEFSLKNKIKRILVNQKSKLLEKNKSPSFTSIEECLKDPFAPLDILFKLFIHKSAAFIHLYPHNIIRDFDDLKPLLVEIQKNEKSINWTELINQMESYNVRFWKYQVIFDSMKEYAAEDPSRTLDFKSENLFWVHTLLISRQILLPVDCFGVFYQNICESMVSWKNDTANLYDFQKIVQFAFSLTFILEDISRRAIQVLEENQMKFEQV